MLGRAPVGEEGIGPWPENAARHVFFFFGGPLRGGQRRPIVSDSFGAEFSKKTALRASFERFCEVAVLNGGPK